MDPEPVLESDQAGLLPFVGLMAGATLEHVRRAVRAITDSNTTTSQRAELQAAVSKASRILTSAKDEAGALVAQATTHASEAARRLGNAAKLEKELRRRPRSSRIS